MVDALRLSTLQRILSQTSLRCHPALGVSLCCNRCASVVSFIPLGRLSKVSRDFLAARARLFESSAPITGPGLALLHCAAPSLAIRGLGIEIKNVSCRRFRFVFRRRSVRRCS